MISPAVWGDSFVLFAVCSAAMAVVLMLCRLRRVSIGRHWVLFFLPALGMTLWGMMWWRENKSLKSLFQIVDVPEVSQAYAPPNGRESKFLARILVKGPQYEPIISQQDREELSKTVESQRDYDLWVIETPVSTPDVRRFYEEERHRKGWQLVNDTEIVLLLQREDRSMLITFEKSTSGKGTTVTYFLQPTNDAARN
jgi:hypothetical protein